MFTFPHQQAIMWTRELPAWEEVAVNYSQLSADIRAIQLWIDLDHELWAMRALPRNWDGFDADPPSSAAVDRASYFLSRLKDRCYSNPPMQIAVSPDGAIGFEWTEGGNYVRAEISDSDEVEWMVVAEGLPTEFTTESLALEDGLALREQTWQPAPAVAGELASAFAL